MDYAISAPPIILAALSQITKRIKLTSATTVLNTVDPVRLFEDFATLDLISNGRAEIIAGRGAFLDSFSLFGYDLNKYNELFGESMDLFLINKEKIVTWNGNYRAPLSNAEISPRPFQKKIPVWIGVGSSEESAARAGKLGTGMALAILGGDSMHFKPHVNIYRQTAEKAGHSPKDIKIGGQAIVIFQTQLRTQKKNFSLIMRITGII